MEESVKFNNIILNKITCPLTNKIFRNPVSIKNIGIFEYEIIEKKYFQFEDITVDYKFKNMIDEFENKKFFDSNMRYQQYSIKENFNPQIFSKIETTEKIIEYLNNIKLYSLQKNLYSIVFSKNKKYDNLKILEFLIEKGIDLEAVDDNKFSLIHYACQEENYLMVKLLVEKGVNFDKKYQSDVKLLIDKGCYISSETNFDLQSFSNIETTEEIIKYLDKINLYSLCKNLYYILFHKNKKYDNLKIMDFLAKKSIDLEFIDVKANCFTREYKIIELACFFSNIEMVKYLIDKGFCLKMKYNLINNINILGQDETKIIELVKILINHGVELVFDDQGYNLIHTACKCQYIELVKFLIDKGIDLNIRGSKSNFFSGAYYPIHFGCIVNNYQLVKLLIDNGAIVEVEDIYKRKPIHYACRNENIEIVKLLIDKGCDLNTNDEIESYYPIHYGCLSNNYQLVKLLLDNGAIAEVEDIYKRKPIQIACGMNYIEIAKLLIEKSNDLEIDISGNNIIHFACRRNDIQMVEMLIARGVNLEATNKDGYKPIDLASKFDIIDLLIKQGINYSYYKINILFYFIMKKYNKITYNLTNVIYRNTNNNYELIDNNTKNNKYL